MMKNIKSILIQFLINKTIEIPSMIIVVRGILLENIKYYTQFFSDECLYKK